MYMYILVYILPCGHTRAFYNPDRWLLNFISSEHTKAKVSSVLVCIGSWVTTSI